MNIKNLLDVTGIDLIPYAIGLSKFTSNTPFEPTKLSDIRDKVQSLDTKKLDEALKYSKELLDEDSTRGEKAESKAYNLIGVTGVSAAFITGISSLLPKEPQTTLSLLLSTLIISYVLIVVSLTLTVLLASRAVMVRNYTYPDIADIFQLRARSLKESKIDRLATYMYCYAKNCQTHNIKISYLMGAQLWFKNSIIFFLILAFVLIISILGGAPNNNIPSITGTPLPTVTLQTQSSTQAMQISSTSSSVQPNTIEPTETLTSLPIITITVTDTPITVTTSP